MITNKDNLFFNLNENVPIHSPDDINQETILFKKLTMDVLEEMHKYSTDERMYEYLSFDAFKDIDETKDYINKKDECIKINFNRVSKVSSRKIIS